MRAAILLCILSLASMGASAQYNANMTGVIKNLITYTDGDWIYLRLENQPATHSKCNPSYFVIANDVPEPRRQVLLSRLMLAYASKESVNIGFDNSVDCAHGYIRIHRVG